MSTGMSWANLGLSDYRFKSRQRQTWSTVCDLMYSMSSVLSQQPTDDLVMYFRRDTNTDELLCRMQKMAIKIKIHAK